MERHKKGTRLESWYRNLHRPLHRWRHLQKWKLRDADYIKFIKSFSCYCRLTEAQKTPTSRHIVPIPKQLLPLLREQKKKSSSAFVIGEDKVQTVRSYQYSFSLLLRRIGVPHRGFHALRHTFATRALECGMDVKTLSEILGHKNPTVTLNRYVHSLMPHKHEMMNRLGKLLWYFTYYYNRWKKQRIFSFIRLHFEKNELFQQYNLGNYIDFCPFYCYNRSCVPIIVIGEKNSLPIFHLWNAIIVPCGWNLAGVRCRQTVRKQTEQEDDMGLFSYLFGKEPTILVSILPPQAMQKIYDGILPNLQADKLILFHIYKNMHKW